MIKIEDLFLPVLIVVDDTITACNDNFSTLVGMDVNTLKDRRLDELLYVENTDSSNTLSITSVLKKAAKDKDGCSVFATLRDINFYHATVEVHCQKYDGKSNNSLKLYFRVIENKSIDPITRLPNGWAMSARATHLFDSMPSNTHKMRLLVLSVDNFSTINFRYGFDAGDNYLLLLGKALQATVKHDGLVVRFSNARFGILIENNHKLSTLDFNAYIAMFSQDLCRLSRKPLILDNGIEINKSFSIGVSEDHSEYESYFSMEIAAEMAMRESERHSNSYYCFANDESKPALMTDKLIIDEFPNAIEKGLINIHYQPQYDLKNKKLVGFEALSRWVHKDLGYIAPDVFIRIAEEIGLHFEFDLWVFTQVCDQIVSWQGMHVYPPRVAINISFKTLEMNDFVNRLAAIIDKSGCPKDLLEIEVTETAGISNIDVLIDNVRAVQELGIHIAVDDFGTGYSSLSLVRKLRSCLNTLKIDRSLVADICVSSLDREFARKVIGIGKVLEVNVLAEGVETLEQRDLLQQLGCDYAQGYYFDKALSTKESKALIIKETCRIV